MPNLKNSSTDSSIVFFVSNPFVHNFYFLEVFFRNTELYVHLDNTLFCLGICLLYRSV